MAAPLTNSVPTVTRRGSWYDFYPFPDDDRHVALPDPVHGRRAAAGFRSSAARDSRHLVPLARRRFLSVPGSNDRRPIAPQRRPARLQAGWPRRRALVLPRPHHPRGPEARSAGDPARSRSRQGRVYPVGEVRSAKFELRMKNYAGPGGTIHPSSLIPHPFVQRAAVRAGDVVAEAREDHPIDAVMFVEKAPHLADRDLGRLLQRIAIGATTDGRKGDAANVVFQRQAQAVAVTGSEQPRLSATSAA